MADVATAVGIAPSALYRHVRGKEELLLAILDEHLTRIERLVEGPPDSDVSGDLVDGLAALTLERREFGLLWERESAHLPDEPRRAIRHRLRAVADVVAARCAEPDPATADLRAWAALAVVDSPSHHRYELDDARFRPLLAGAARAVLAAPLPPATGPSADPARPGVLAPASRREALLAAATRLFGERGYPAVGLGDIGAARHRGAERLPALHDEARPPAPHPAPRERGAVVGPAPRAGAGARAPDAVARLAADYTAFVADNPEIVSVLVSQVIHLPAPSRDELRRSQRDYVAEWVALLTAARPGLPAPEARVLVHAALALINGLTRVPHLAVQPGAGRGSPPSPRRCWRRRDSDPSGEVQHRLAVGRRVRRGAFLGRGRRAARVLLAGRRPVRGVGLGGGSTRPGRPRGSLAAPAPAPAPSRRRDPEHRELQGGAAREQADDRAGHRDREGVDEAGCGTRRGGASAGQRGDHGVARRRGEQPPQRGRQLGRQHDGFGVEQEVHHALGRLGGDQPRPVRLEVGADALAGARHVVGVEVWSSAARRTPPSSSSSCAGSLPGPITS